MNVTLVMVMSLDGKTTMDENPTSYQWSSPEDHKHFIHLKKSYKVLVMGRNTYDTVKDSLQLSSTLRRIVMTHKPMQYASFQVPGQLEFTDESPEELVRRLEREGYSSLLLVGGSTVNTSFLNKRLITDCFITIEPRFFGSGGSMFSEMKADIRLTMLKVQPLNTQGTLVVHYKLDYDPNTY